MRTRGEIISQLEELMYSFEDAEKFALIEDIIPYAQSIKKYFEGKESGEALLILTDDYGVAGFVTMSSDLYETIYNYVDSLNPKNEEEREEYTESVRVIPLSQLI